MRGEICIFARRRLGLCQIRIIAKWFDNNPKMVQMHATWKFDKTTLARLFFLVLMLYCLPHKTLVERMKMYQHRIDFTKFSIKSDVVGNCMVHAWNELKQIHVLRPVRSQSKMRSGVSGNTEHC